MLDGGLKPEPLGVGIPPADLNVEIIEKKIVYKSHTANYNHVIYKHKAWKVFQKPRNPTPIDN